MKRVISFLQPMPIQDRDAFAARCGTSMGYLRKLASTGNRPSAGLAIALERESKGALRCEDLCPGVDWAYLRGTATAAIAAAAPHEVGHAG